MKTYNITLTLIYNGSMTVKAENEEQALQLAQDSLNHETLKDFPNDVAIPNGSFTFGEATADYADLLETDSEPNGTDAKSPTIEHMVISDGRTVDVRKVQIPDELGKYVLVSSETVRETLYNEVTDEYDADDDLFYGYVPDHEFYTLTDDELQAWVNKYLN